MLGGSTWKRHDKAPEAAVPGARTLDAAVWSVELAVGDGPGRIYIVEPTGPLEDDPNLTDKNSKATKRAAMPGAWRALQ